MIFILIIQCFADRIKQFRSFKVLDKNESLKSHNTKEGYENIRNAFMQNTQNVTLKTNFSTKNVTSSDIMFNPTDGTTNNNFGEITSSYYFKKH